MSDGPEGALVATPLTRLLQSRMDERGWALRDVVRPPDGVREGGPARSTMSQHLQAGYWLSTMPRPQTIAQLAIAVRLPEAAIREAAWLSLAANRGTDKRRADPEAHELEQPVGLGLDDEASDLTPEQIESVRAVIRAMKPST